MTYKVYNIVYDIEEEDLELDFTPDDFDSFLDFEEAVDKEFERVERDLPDELYIELDDNVDENDIVEVEEFLCDAISDETGWMVYCFDYEEVEG